MSHLDFSEDDLIDSTSTSSPQNEPTSTIPVQTRALKSARCKNRKPARPVSTLDESVPESIPVPPSLYTKSPNFYFSDLIEVRLGEPAVYRVPATILQQLALPHALSNEKPLDICCPPVLLQDVSPTQMEVFLDVADSRLISGEAKFTFQQLAGALFVAKKFGPVQIRAHIVKLIERGLDRLDPFDCIEVAEEYWAKDWLVRPFCRVCERADSLSPSEMARLGLERSSAVARIRETVIRALPAVEAVETSRNPSPSPEVVKVEEETPPYRDSTRRLIENEPLLSQLLPSSSMIQRPQSMDTPVVPFTRFNLSDFIRIKVQSCLYSLPIAYFGSSGIIRVLRKQANEDLVVLPFDCSQVDWEIFLKIVTARPYEDPIMSLSFPQWVRGLHVAKLMEHDQATNYIRTEIQAKFSEQDPVDLLEAAKIGEMPKSRWLQGCFSALAKRKEAISAEEVVRIGAEATAIVCELREQTAYLRGRSSLCGTGKKALRR